MFLHVEQITSYFPCNNLLSAEVNNGCGGLTSSLSASMFGASMDIGIDPILLDKCKKTNKTLLFHSGINRKR